jgi:hypothetical protein
LAKILPESNDVRLLNEDEPAAAGEEIDPRWSALLNLQNKLDSEKN